MLVVSPSFPWGHWLFFIRAIEEWRKRLKSLAMVLLYSLLTGAEALPQ